MPILRVITDINITALCLPVRPTLARLTFTQGTKPHACSRTWNSNRACSGSRYKRECLNTREGVCNYLLALYGSRVAVHKAGNHRSCNSVLLDLYDTL
jgi:hypothetical protein